MKTINIEIKNEIIKCPKCSSENIGENGIKDICEHLIFVGTSESDEPELDKEKLILKENLNNSYFLFTDSRTRQIDLYLIYKNI